MFLTFFPRSWWERVLLPAIAIVFFLVWIDRPEAPNTGLDQSWQAVLSDSYFEGRQFGRDVVFTHGPWGFVANHFQVPEALGAKRLWELVAKLAVAFAFGMATLPWPLLRRWAFLLGLALTIWRFPDAGFVVFILVVTLAWLFDPEAAPAWVVAVALVGLGLLANMKFSLLLFALAGVLAATTSLCGQGRWRRAIVLLAGFIIATAAWWVAAGQALALLPTSWRLGLELARGYGDAMLLRGKPSVVYAALAAASCSGVYLMRLMGARRDRARVWPAAAFVAAVWFMSWKHGLTRADEHALGFFLVALLGGIAVPALLGAGRSLTWMDAGAACALAGLALFDVAQVRYAPSITLARLRPAADYVLRPSASRASFLVQWDARKAQASRPEVRDVVGLDSIDVLGHSQATAILNGLDYTPRPVFQSYCTYTPELLRQNRRFFLKHQAPRYVLVDFGTIDDRFPAQDDSLALLEIRRRYEVVIDDRATLLLRRRVRSPDDPAPGSIAVAEGALALGEELPLPETVGYARQLQVWVEATPLGRARRALYRPVEIMMVLTSTDDERMQYRLVPGMAGEGFVIQPLLQRQADVAAFLQGRGLRGVRSVRFEPRARGESVFLGPLRYRLSELRDVPIAYR